MTAQGPSLAQFHGLFAQVVFGLLLTLAASTSRDWVVGPVNEVKLKWLRRWVVATAAAILGQAALGGVIRHRDLLLASRLHLLGAFVVFAFLFVVIKFAGDGLRLVQTVGTRADGTVDLSSDAGSGSVDGLDEATLLSGDGGKRVGGDAADPLGTLSRRPLIFATTAVLLVKAFWAPRRVEAPPS